MMVKIYLRSIVKDKEDHLALFDTNRNGDIDKLITVVPKGAKVIWELDHCSGIKSITKIYSKKGKRNIFKSDPKKQLLCKRFELQLSDSAKVVIDPYIRIQPPSVPNEKNG
jgi:hypothetical protein